jgi:hypothetical protein
MGRPLNKRFFDANAQENIKVQFHNGTASKPGFIVRQRGAAKFLCQDKAGNQAVCFLVDKAAGDLLPGEMSITVKTDAGTIKQVTKISAHKITAGGVTYPWNFSTSTTDAAVEVEEAGTDDQQTDATNLEGDAEV